MPPPGPSKSPPSAASSFGSNALFTPQDDAPTEPLKDLLLGRLRDGGCAAVVCNTVGEAQQIYLALQPLFSGLASDGEPELDLLHSRFLFEHREQREHRCLRRFGKSSDTRPHRSVLVATQIVEQSLDLDFDFIVTDMAPVDLLLQRAGRLHRHQRGLRPAPLREPSLAVRMPPLDPSGAPRFPQPWRHVYETHVLLRTWLALQNRSSIAIPDDVEFLIESVYDDRPCPPDISPALAAAWEQSLGKLRLARQSEAHQANLRLLKKPFDPGQLWRFTGSQLEEDSPDLHQAFQALTRLSEPAVDIICLNPLSPAPGAVPDLEQTKALLRCSVRVTGSRLYQSLSDLPVPAAWRKSPLLRHCRSVALDAQGRATVGSLCLVYRDDIGLRIE